MLQQAEIIRHTVAALGDGAEAGENPAVQLSGIGLSADIEEPLKPESFPQQPVQLLAFSMIPVKKLPQKHKGLSVPVSDVASPICGQSPQSL